MRKKKTFKITSTFDMLSVYRVHKKCFPEDEWYESPNPVHYWLVTDEKGRHVGFCILTFLPEEDTAFLSRAGVVYSAQGRGLQKRLIRVREKAAKKMGFKTVITYTTIDNIASSRNLQKCGYKLYYPDYLFAGKNCLYWIKEL